ncbi:MAG: alpha/beta hydrolase [Gammaproteobacteria bacterium]|nr:alpha/beta hydrolase [Gammaproteobacteria bacterium]
MPGRIDAPVVIETGTNPVASILWLHGLGADGHDFEPIVPELRLPESLSLRFVFPHAPYRPVTLNGGYEMRAWYDIAIDDRGFHQNESHIRESDVQLREFIEHERARGIESKRIVLAGFSQGAAMALHTGLRYSEPLAGIMALSMPIPLPDKIAAERRPENSGTPVFLAHGTADPVVPYAMGEAAHHLLTGLGQPVEWHAYNMEHSVIPREIADIRAWLLRVLEAA